MNLVAQQIHQIITARIRSLACTELSIVIITNCTNRIRDIVFFGFCITSPIDIKLTRVNQYDDGQSYLGRLGYLGNSSEMAIELQQSQFSGQQQTAISASLDGSLLWMGGQFAPMRRSLGAFALVSTSGIPHVPVMLENRNVGYTNDQGFLLVNSLNACAGILVMSLGLEPV